MKHLLLFALLTVGTNVPQSISPQPQWIFNNAFKCIFPWIDPNAHYNYGFNYGCYCDSFRWGNYFTNYKDMDRCCNTRDKCYVQVNKLENCGSLIGNPYLSSYLYSCSGDEIICSDKNEHCENFICNCDRQGTDCFSKTLYHKVFKGIGCYTCQVSY